VNPLNERINSVYGAAYSYTHLFPGTKDMQATGV
jgi:hypothetical protein